MSPRLDTLTAEQRDILAAAWLGDALDEHASLASFARFSLQLLSLGAPPDLLRAAHRASLDEIAHAELCFALASAYSEKTLGPGPLAVQDALMGTEDLDAAVSSAIEEGCVGETVSAMVALASAEHCDDPCIAKAWRRIAADETRHAGLAWRFVRWALAKEPRLADTIREVFDHICATPAGQVPEPRDVGWLERHGRLTHDARSAIAARTRREVVAPCAHALLAADVRVGGVAPSRRV